MPSNVLIFPAPVCFYIGRLFSAAKMARLKNTSSLRKRKHRLLIALFHFVAKVRQFANPRLLIKAAVAEFIGTFGLYKMVARLFLYFHTKSRKIRLFPLSQYFTHSIAFFKPFSLIIGEWR